VIHGHGSKIQNQKTIFIRYSAASEDKEVTNQISYKIELRLNICF
jgi:hypothetical protein